MIIPGSPSKGRGKDSELARKNWQEKTGVKTEIPELIVRYIKEIRRGHTKESENG